MAAHLVLLVAWPVWWISWMAAAWWSGTTIERADTRAQLPYRALTLVGIIVLFGFYWGDHPIKLPLWRVGPVLAWVLVAIAVLGFAFAWWARLHLGRLWSSNVTRKADHHIVDTGPYGLVRHPIYTGLIIAALATAAQCGTAVAFLGAALLIFGWYLKAMLEERFLRARLGREAYDAYARRVPMMVPMAPR